MTGDILREAAQALRDTSVEGGPGDRFTRARVMVSLHQRRQRRSLGRVLSIPLAAILVGSTAWAGATGRLPEVFRLVAHRVQPPPRTEARADLGRAVAHRAARAAAAVARPEPTPAPAPADLEPPAPSAAASASGPDELLLYRAAHRAHFEAHDPAAALRAWDEYLAAAPRGRFSVEARYNRALCLVRLGRREPARAALGPFARGAYGEYRRREAEELLEALGAEP
jgi:hypothetical protein